MKIEFDKIGTSVLENFKGGEKELSADMFFDGTNRIFKGRLVVMQLIHYLDSLFYLYRNAIEQGMLSRLLIVHFICRFSSLFPLHSFAQKRQDL